MKKITPCLLVGCMLVLTIFVTLMGTVLAQPPGYYQRGFQPQYQNQPTAAKKQQSPVALLEESINKVIAFLSQAKPRSSEEITRFIIDEIAPHFDFQYMSQWVAGRYYRQMSKQQQTEFTRTFTNLFVTTLVQKLSAYRTYPPVVEAFMSKRTGQNEALATARVLQENGRELKVDFKFVKTKNGWKVIDVKANGISALFHYRNYFAQQMHRKQQRQAKSK
jgi:phospholipid transport system substrate-binding protein